MTTRKADDECVVTFRMRTEYTVEPSRSWALKANGKTLALFVAPGAVRVHKVTIAHDEKPRKGRRR